MSMATWKHNQATLSATPIEEAIKLAIEAVELAEDKLDYWAPLCPKCGNCRTFVLAFSAPEKCLGCGNTDYTNATSWRCL